MAKKYVFAIIIALLSIILAGGWYLSGQNIAVLNPQGTIAEKQRDLMIITTLLGLLIVVPVFALTFGIAWKYRASNTKAKYSPDWDHNRTLETTWWAIPIALITVLAVIAWKSSHDLDPYRPLESNVKPVTIQVIALDWKWLFIYPEQNIATVNYLQIPVDTPINFEITADAPMNSFWIPQLGGQVYAMAGMQTKLHLMAENPGAYDGSSANLSGEGFAGMKFTAKATSREEFERWVEAVKLTPEHLSLEAYAELAKPSKNVSDMYYASRAENLYDTVMMKYMGSGHSMPATHGNHGEGY